MEGRSPSIRIIAQAHLKYNMLFKIGLFLVVCGVMKLLVALFLRWRDKDAEG